MTPRHLSFPEPKSSSLQRSQMNQKYKTPGEAVEFLLSNAHWRGECLISHLKPNARGYVPIGIGGRGGIKWRAHRLVYAVKIRAVPAELMVLHTCDNRACINPAHLFVGTAKDNTQDMMQKGRHKYITHRKIDAKKLQLMKDLEAEGLNKFAIAAQLGVTYETVRVYLNGDKHV